MSQRNVALQLSMIAFALCATAGTKEWVGASGGLWSEASNWSPSGAPSYSDVVVFRPVGEMIVENKTVSTCNGMRFESAMKSFLVVPGLNCGAALQMFKNRPNLKREFELVHWGRNQAEHLFLKVRDSGTTNRRWTTADLGTVIRVTPPKVSVLPTGEVITLHRATQDAFIRTVFWSLPEVFEFQEHEEMLDPDVAGTARVKELYEESGGVAPVKKAWWKFW